MFVTEAHCELGKCQWSSKLPHLPPPRPRMALLRGTVGSGIMSAERINMLFSFLISPSGWTIAV